MKKKLQRTRSLKLEVHPLVQVRQHKKKPLMSANRRPIVIDFQAWTALMEQLAPK